MRAIRVNKTTMTFAASLALVTGLAACSSGATPDESAAPEPDQTMGTGEMDGDMQMIVSTGNPFADARTAAAHMPGTADTLAGGFVKALSIPGEIDSAAADLRAGLTALLQEHVYLAGYAVATAYTTGADSAEFELAAATLDDNTSDLQAAVTSLAGEENGEAFGNLWRAHIGFFVDYAVAVKTGDTAGAAEAQEALQGYTAAAGAFFEDVSGGELPAAAVSESLTMHISTLSTAIDDLAAGSTDAYDSLQEAASHVVGSAAVLAGGLAKATDMAGDGDDEASDLRSGLTALLQEHVYLAGLAVFTAYTAEGSIESDAFAASAATLDANSVALADAVGSLAGEDKGRAFLDLWRAHVGFFVDYAVAQATGDEGAAEDALSALDGYRSAAGAFFEEISGGELPAAAIEEGLAMHVQTLGGAIQSLETALLPQG
jgi:hypothetical protein